MTDFQIINRSRHGDKGWLKVNHYRFFAKESLCPLVIQELPKAMLGVPIGFMVDGDSFTPVAIQGLAPSKNLLVAEDGRWLSPYIPAPYRGYPFRLGRTEQGDVLLCIDEDSGLIVDNGGEPFYDPEGNASQSLQDIFEFFRQIEINRQLTLQVCAVLHRHKLIKPWSLTLKNKEGQQQISDLYCIDEVVLHALSSEALQELRDTDALTIIYCQLLSMQHMATMEKLANAHAELDEERRNKDSLAANRELNLEFMNKSDTFSFGNLS